MRRALWAAAHTRLGPMAPSREWGAGRLSVSERWGYHGVPYPIFETEELLPEALGTLSAESAKELLSEMAQCTAIEREPAATKAYRLEGEEMPSEIVDGFVQYVKPLKTIESRLDRAGNLLSELDFS